MLAEAIKERAKCCKEVTTVENRGTNSEKEGANTSPQSFRLRGSFRSSVLIGVFTDSSAKNI